MNAVVHSVDWYEPDYLPIWQKRIERKAKMRNPDPDPITGVTGPEYVAAMKLYYPTHIPEFIEHWGVTVDPRNSKPGVGFKKKPILMPFMLFPKQRELLDWLIERWEHADQGDGDGVVVKSRDCGASWIAMAFSITVCLFYPDVSIGFGSALKDKVDNAGDPDSLFYKGRMFLRHIPREFKDGWEETNHRYSADMRLIFPAKGSSITGECGDKMGRGGRKTMYFADEFAHVERSKLVDRNLGANTDCRIELSSVNGMANVFAEHARGGLIPRFDFDYHDDPRKTNLTGKTVTCIVHGNAVDIIHGALWPWFAAKLAKMDPVAKAQEYDRDFMASMEGIIIPQEWVEAAVDAHIKLNIEITGSRRGCFDVADQGKDKCCYLSAKGILIDFIESWKGKGSDTFKSVERVFRLADQHKDDDFIFDQDGMGALVRGDSNKINDERTEWNKANPKSKPKRIITAAAFRGSAAVEDPEMSVPGTEGDVLNKDRFENFKAQCWWALRCRFRTTWQAVTGQITDYDVNELISLSSALKELALTKSELSQPIWKWSKTGKMMIDKTPDDVASPNNADCVMMRFGYSRPPMEFSDDLLEQLAAS